MPDREEPTYRLSEIVGTSNESIHQAVRNGLKRASRTIRNLDWFEGRRFEEPLLTERWDTFRSR